MRVTHLLPLCPIHHDSLLLNAIDIITKCDSYFILKMQQKFITKFIRFLITKCDDFITKCDSYYKMRRLLQTATVNRDILLRYCYLHTSKCWY